MGRHGAPGLAAATVAVLIATSCGGGPQPSTSRLNLASCTVQSLAARCGRLPVAENPANPGGRKISLNVVVLPARTKDRAPDPLFYLEGGPGGGGTYETSWAALRFQAFNLRHDIVLIDQRGTGDSNEVDCAVPRGISTEAELSDAIQNCLGSVTSKADPTQYTTPISADDIDQVRTALGYGKIDVYGVSYGVTLGLAYIQRHGAQVRTALFDSGSMLDFRIWENVPVTAQQALNRLFDRCRSDELCNGAFPNVKAEFAGLMARLSRGPVQLDIVDPVSGAFVELDKVSFGGLLIDSYLSTWSGIAALPRAVHAAAGGDWSAFAQNVEASMKSSDSLSMMRQTITCGDEWSSLDPARQATIAPDSPFAPWEMMFASSQNEICKYWPHATGARGPVESSAPVVFLNALSDPVDPPDHVAGAAADMPNSLVVPIEGAGHWQLNYDPTGCLAQKTNAFFEKGARPVPADWNCVDMQPVFAT